MMRKSCTLTLMLTLNCEYGWTTFSTINYYLYLDDVCCWAYDTLVILFELLSRVMPTFGSPLLLS